jgi:hypothetical protein
MKKNAGDLKMSLKQARKLCVLERLCEGRISNREAASNLNLSVRQTQRANSHFLEPGLDPLRVPHDTGFVVSNQRFFCPDISFEAKSQAFLGKRPFRLAFYVDIRHNHGCDVLCESTGERRARNTGFF